VDRNGRVAPSVATVGSPEYSSATVATVQSCLPRRTAVALSASAALAKAAENSVPQLCTVHCALTSRLTVAGEYELYILYRLLFFQVANTAMAAWMCASCPN
jgi:hypothetical protein